jgi:protein-tyrosine phosphatase
MARPGDATWRRAGVDVIVSLLEPEEAADLELAGRRAYCEANGIEFHSFPIPDRSVPAGFNIRKLVSNLDSKPSQGKNVAIHCRQGIGRAGLMAAALLIEHGLSPEEAIRRVSTARRIPIPKTEEQKLWPQSFAASLARKH